MYPNPKKFVVACLVISSYFITVKCFMYDVMISLNRCNACVMSMCAVSPWKTPWLGVFQILRYLVHTLSAYIEYVLLTVLWTSSFDLNYGHDT